MEMAKPPRPPARPRVVASRKDHGGGGVRQPPRGHGPPRARLPPASAPAPAPSASGLLPPASASSAAAPAPVLIPPYLYARSLWKVANVNLEMSDEETEEEYESRKKAEWCCGA
ncbi:hypothetical protein CFC21_079856 [Triticum aestivum]|uniref:Uncharacterized protein n=1 Tax=Triticum aestivum TaxID=4565 RepID=A0A9R1I118_WHEAT|nr:hypothetical protein CFC21_079856 [Triticum aestivum]